MSGYLYGCPGGCLCGYAGRGCGSQSSLFTRSAVNPACMPESGRSGMSETAGGEPPGAQGPRRGPVVLTCVVITVAAAVIGVLVAAASGFDHHVMVVTSFILVIAAVSPIFA